jgi:uncharacterized protein YjbI with pentapeptide repeats
MITTSPSTPPLLGKTFFLGGRSYVLATPAFRQLLSDLGATVADRLSAKVDYVVLGKPGSKTVEKQVRKLLAAGATFQVLTEKQLKKRIAPSLDYMETLLRKGAKGVEQFNRWHVQYWMQDVLPRLKNLDLSGLNLRQICPTYRRGFEGVNLTNTNLSEAVGLNVKNCVLDGANVAGAHFTAIKECSMVGVDFTKVQHLPHHLQKCNLSRACFRGHHFWGPRFENSILDEADFSRAQGRNFRFAKASAVGAKFAGAVLINADFSGADLRRCDFRRANLTNAKLHRARVDGADFTGAVLSGANLNQVDVRKAKGLDLKSTQSHATAGSAVKEYIAQATSAKSSVITTIEVMREDELVTLRFTKSSTGFETNDDYRLFQERKPLKSGASLLCSLANCWHNATPDLASMDLYCSDPPISLKEMKQLALQMWCELFHLPVPSAAELSALRKEARANRARYVEKWLTVLRDDSKGVEKWNRLVNSIARVACLKLLLVDLSNAKLRGLEFAGWTCKDSNFAGADLTGARMNGSRFPGGNFARSKLVDLKASYTRFTQANLEGVDAHGASCIGASFQGTNCRDANLRAADLRWANLCGADLTGADLTNARLDRVAFDELTKFPQGFELPKKTRWKGIGPRPTGGAPAAVSVAGQLTADTFVQRLQQTTDSGKLKNALKMLKADRFKLYAQVDDEQLVGVVKSQTDSDLVYSCTLASDGGFGCCTQNLNVCGGLNGSICKHLLVLIVGLAKAGELDPNVVDTWIVASQKQKPTLDRDAMSDIFLKYKGAEAGEVDWRPTETIPEDYYAM